MEIRARPKGLIFIQKIRTKEEVRYMKMEQANYIKAIFTAVFAFLSALLGVLAVPVILLVACNLIDYMTGLMASKYRAEDINSYKSIRGIFKKVSMWLLVVVGAIIDEMLLYASSTIGWKSPVTFLIACIVAMWLICNEIISILENIQDMALRYQRSCNHWSNISGHRWRNRLTVVIQGASNRPLIDWREIS